MKNRIMLLLAVVALSVSAWAAPTGKNVKPFVIPELREWKGSTGEFTITEKTRIVYERRKKKIE